MVAISIWDSGEILFSIVRVLLLLFVLYFLAVVIYWFNRTGRVPSLKFIWRMMVQLFKWFPKILFHRIKITPARLRRKKVSAYPELGIKKSTSRTRKKRK